MAPQVDRRFGGVILAVFFVAGVADTVAARADTPSVTRFLSPTGQLLPESSRPRSQATTYFVIHGFQATGREKPSIRLAGAITTRFPSVNVVIVDWGRQPAQEAKPEIGWLNRVNMAAEYLQAVQQAPKIGQDIVQWMLKQGIRPEETVLCGHSLGAQIAAFASKQCARPDRFGRAVRAILAADPAGPMFSGAVPRQRLDPADADEVIVIHATECLGDKNMVGTVDIYILWPESVPADYRRRHSAARELLAQSFLQPCMANADGTPFGINILALRDPRQRGFEMLWDGTNQRSRARATYIAADEQHPEPVSVAHVNRATATRGAAPQSLARVASAFEPVAK